MSTDDVRGSDTGMTVKELLVEVREDVKAMRSVVDIMASQKLNERVDALEKRAEREDGRDNLIKAVLGASALGALIGLVNLFDLIQHAAH